MYPQTHFLFAFFLAEIFVQIGWLNHYSALICAVLAVIIDFDHIIEHFLLTKDRSLKRFWNNSVMKNDPRERTILHHLPGFIIFLILPIAIWFSAVQNRPAAIIIAVAYWSHMFLDTIRIHIMMKKVDIKECGFHIPIYMHEVALDAAFLVLGLVLIFV